MQFSRDPFFLKKTQIKGRSKKIGGMIERLEEKDTP